MYGKRRPLAIVWYQLHVSGGFIFKFTGGVVTTPLGKLCKKGLAGRVFPQVLILRQLNFNNCKNIMTKMICGGLGRRKRSGRSENDGLKGKKINKSNIYIQEQTK